MDNASYVKCIKKISSSLEDMIKRRDWNWKDTNNNHVINVKVEDEFTSVVVCAVYTYSSI